MNSRRVVPANQAAVGILAVALFSLAGLSARAQSVQHLTITQPGGLPGMPVMTGIERDTNGLTVTWDGPSGYYQLVQKLNLNDPKWQALGARTNLARRATITTIYSNAFFRVSGPAPLYVGGQACAECHQKIHDSETNTLHAQAFAALQQAGQDKNPACLPCHTVGYGLPSGFVNQTATPRLANVQCENCHGPAANHAANPDDPTVRPRVELAATVCGGCHSGPQQPTYEEWSSSAHVGVVEDMNPTNRIDSCGRCHSGSARVSLLKNQPLPVGDANMGIVCPTCHDPHQKTANPAQLRNPITSTNDFYLATSDVFSNKYNPNINICAQCHNHRGASWTSTSRAPHHSPQYNFLLGTVGELASGLPPNQPAAHALLIPGQCSACHMQTSGSVGRAQSSVTGHTFEVASFNLCLACHPLPEPLLQFTTGVVSNQIQQVKATLDLWANTKAPASLRLKYGTRAWEYSTPGDLSPGGPGPTSSEQALIPVNIQKARYNLYLVLYDGSYGAHNGPYSIVLLDTAQNWVEQALSQ